MDDKQIVELYWQRNEQAIAETAAKYETYCMKISQNILSDRADSEENVNDTYLHTWEAIPPQRPAILSAFLGRIARNLALNRYKAKSAQKRQGDAFALSLDELTDAASLSHMMTANPVTAGAFHVTNSSDVDTVVSDLKDNIMNRQWMCGFPDKLVVLTLGDYVVSCFGAEELVDEFSEKVTAAFSGASVVCDEPIV